MVTIKEVAAKCGVSSMTVSNVVNKKYNEVSEKTIAIVEKAMKDLNYIPNMSARSLKSNNSNIIVLIIPQSLENDPDKNNAMKNPFYGEFINSIEYNLRKCGYYLMLKFVDENEIYHPYLKLWNADGVIVLGADQMQFDLNLLSVDIPVVMVDTYIESDNSYCTVNSDDRLGGFLAAEFLLRQGCKNLGVVGTDMRERGVSRERYLGFSAYAESSGVCLESKNIFEGYPSYNYGIIVAEKILRNSIDGVFAFSDMVAFGIIEGAKRNGKEIPKDLSVIGFDGFFIGDISNPKLTTIKQDVYQKGEKTVEILIKKMKNKDYNENLTLPVKLVIKSSVCNYNLDDKINL